MPSNVPENTTPDVYLRTSRRTFFTGKLREKGIYLFTAGLISVSYLCLVRSLLACLLLFLCLHLSFSSKYPCIPFFSPSSLLFLRERERFDVLRSITNKHTNKQNHDRLFSFFLALMRRLLCLLNPLLPFARYSYRYPSDR